MPGRIKWRVLHEDHSGPCTWATLHSCYRSSCFAVLALWKLGQLGRRVSLLAQPGTMYLCRKLSTWDGVQAQGNVEANTAPCTSWDHYSYPTPPSAPLHPSPAIHHPFLLHGLLGKADLNYTWPSNVSSNDLTPLQVASSFDGRRVHNFWEWLPGSSLCVLVVIRQYQVVVIQRDWFILWNWQV